jgi:hypothetical protein
MYVLGSGAALTWKHMHPGSFRDSIASWRITSRNSDSRPSATTTSTLTQIGRSIARRRSLFASERAPYRERGTSDAQTEEARDACDKIARFWNERVPSRKRRTGNTAWGASKQCRKYKNNIESSSPPKTSPHGSPCEIASSLLGAKGGAKRQRRDERDRPAVGAPRVGQGPDVEATAEQAVRPLPARLSAKTAVRFSRSLALVPSEERSVDMTSVGGHEERVSHRRSRVSRVPPREPHRTSRERRLYRREPARVGAFLTSP